MARQAPRNQGVVVGMLGRKVVAGLLSPLPSLSSPARLAGWKLSSVYGLKWRFSFFFVCFGF